MNQAIQHPNLPVVDTHPIDDILNSIYKLIIDKKFDPEALSLLIWFGHQIELEQKQENEGNRDASRSLVSEISQHLENATQFSKQLGNTYDNNRVLSSIIKQLDVPLVSIDSSGVIQFFNPAFEALRPNAFNLQPAEFIFKNQDELDALRAFLMSFNASGAKQYRVNSGDTELTTFIINVDPASNGLYALFIPGHDNFEKILEHACSSYRLTQREQDITRLLFRNLSLNDIADELSISRETVKHHLKSIYIRTNTSRLEQLITRLFLTYANFSPSVLVNSAIDTHTDRSNIWGRPDSVLLPDGRLLDYQEFGERINASATYVYFHSQGGSRCELPIPLYADTFDKVKQHWISVSRPGYGGSSSNRSRTHLDFADDLEHLRKSLRLDLIIPVSMCSGSVYALSYAHRYPEAIKEIFMISPLPSCELIINASKPKAGLKLLFKGMNALPKKTVAYIISAISELSPKIVLEDVTAMSFLMNSCITLSKNPQ